MESSLFRKLVMDLAEQLRPEDIKKCSFLYQIPDDSATTGLDALGYLMNKGTFSHSNIDALEKVLEDIDRCELVSDFVGKYREEHAVNTAESRSGQEKPSVTGKQTESSEEDLFPQVHEALSPEEDARSPSPKQEEGAGEHTELCRQPSSLSLISSTYTSRHKFKSRGVHSETRSNLSGSLYSFVPYTPPSDNGSLFSHPSIDETIIRNRGYIHPPVKELKARDKTSSQSHSLESQVDEHKEELHNEQEQESPPTSDSSNHDHGAQKDASWGIGRKLMGLIGWGRGKSTPKKTQYTWGLERQTLHSSIWEHKKLDHEKCPNTIPIDVDCGPDNTQNPYLTLHLYPFGLFDDANKSMTLQVKVVTPDCCPPIPTSATFNMSWTVRTSEKDGNKELGCSKKKIYFDTGIIYIHKLVSHNTLKNEHFKTLEIQFDVDTTYTVHNDYDFPTDTEKGTAQATVGADAATASLHHPTRDAESDKEFLLQ